MHGNEACLSLIPNNLFPQVSQVHHYHSYPCSLGAINLIIITNTDNRYIGRLGVSDGCIQSVDWTGGLD